MCLEKKAWYTFSHACINYLDIRVMYVRMWNRLSLESRADSVSDSDRKQLLCSGDVLCSLF